FLFSLPFASSLQQQPLLQDTSTTATSSSWNLNFSSPAPHYFASAYGLLQQWSNTFFPNGHSLVPCEIAPLTKLYHGRMDADVPPSPEWVAFDMQLDRGMAYGIMGGTRNSHMLTYQTTRPVKCIYFDGESATLFGTGQMDTQMLHIWGNVTGPPRPEHGGFRFLWEEYARASGICDWFRGEGLGGPGWGYEGVVRMNAGFEMIWCNFTSPSLRLISHLNVTTPLLPPKDDEERALRGHSTINSEATSYFPLPPSPTRTDSSLEPSTAPLPPLDNRWQQEPFLSSKLWFWFVSGVDHYGSTGDGPSTGEVRVKPLSCGFLSYYSPEFSNQALARAREERKVLNLTTDGHWLGPTHNDSRSEALKALTRRRRSHALDGVTGPEAAFMRNNSERVLRDLLSSSPANCSGVDWNVMTNDIVGTYAGRLKILLKSLHKHEQLPKSNQTALTNWLSSIRQQTHDFLLPFLEYPEEEADEAIWTRESDLFRKTYSQCQFQYTRLLDPEEGFDLGPEERTMKWAVEETLGGICAILVDVGLSAEGLWQARFNDPSTMSRLVPFPQSLEAEFIRWTQGIEELMAWLGWAGEWTRCEKKCDLDEKCYIPMWPLVNMGRFPGGRYPPPRGPGYGYPYPPPYPYGRMPDFPRNRTGGGPGRGRGRGWQQDETTLWDPICVKADYITRG
ncbi:Uncharacterized protein LCER1_G007280, partial [Lachnellula cervina]